LMIGAIGFIFKFFWPFESIKNPVF
jgi:hypothetical protein